MHTRHFAATAIALSSGVALAEDKKAMDARPAVEKCYGVAMAGRGWPGCP
jgi:uncharacterized membrane protein